MLTLQQVVLATETLLSPGTFAIKISILLLYRRVFPSRRLRILLIYYGVFLVIFLLAQVLSVIFQCSPVAALWDPTAYPDARCDNYVPALILLAVVNVVTDLLTLAIPLPILWKLKVSSSRRWQLIAMFSLGGLYVLFSISFLLLQFKYVNLPDQNLRRRNLSMRLYRPSEPDRGPKL